MENEELYNNLDCNLTIIRNLYKEIKRTEEALRDLNKEIDKCVIALNKQPIITTDNEYDELRIGKRELEKRYSTLKEKSIELSSRLTQCRGALIRRHPIKNVWYHIEGITYILITDDDRIIEKVIDEKDRNQYYN